MDDALAALEAVGSGEGKALGMRFFGGFTAEETMGILGLTVSSIPPKFHEWLRTGVAVGSAAGST